MAKFETPDWDLLKETAFTLGDYIADCSNYTGVSKGRYYVKGKNCTHNEYKLYILTMIQ